ncbi:MAG TPA: protein kinase [Polyangiaceae bacterium]
MSFALATGATLGRYQLLVPLGQGGMGSVWVAREESPASGKERLVAIKVMRPEFAQHSNFRAMFLKEGQLVRSIEHDNVVGVYEVAEHEGVLWLTMEWVEGESLEILFSEASKRRPIPAEMAVRIVADTAKGLHAAHELRGWDGELEGIVHRDVSPHNILIGLDGRIKVADFGLAKATESSGMSLTEAPHGKYSYMSPEQARGQSVDRRSDVFSLGVVLYELTTGERLFKGVDRHHTLGLVMQCKVPPPRSKRPNYPAGLEAIVMRALANKPDDRYQSADAMRVALERHLVQERTLVSAGSVAALLRRVVGKRLEAQRQAIHDALLATVGHVNAELLPDTTLLTSSARASDPSEPSRSSISLPIPSETPHAISHSQPFMRAPAVRKRNGTLRVALIGGGGAAAAFSLMLLAGKLLGNDPVSDPAAPGAASVPAALRATHPEGKAPSVEGLSVSDLPLEEREEREERERARTPGAAARPPVRPATAPTPVAPKPVWLEEAAPGEGPTPPSGPGPTAPTPADTPPEGAEEKTLPVSPYAAPEPPTDATKPKIVLEEEPETPPPPAEKPGPYRLRVPGQRESD